DLVALPALQTQPLQQLRYASPRDLGRNPVEVGEVAQVVEPGEPPVKPALATEDEADPPSYRPRVTHGVEAQDPRLARRREQKRGENLDDRRLAGTVRTQQAEELAAADRKVDALECR